MAKSSNQKMKILYLMKILMEYTDENHGLTIAEITDKLSEYGINAERKSLYDDFEVLRVFGLDIITTKDKHFRYHIASRDFELPELKLLVDSVQSSKFITHKKSNELIKKLENLLSIHEAHLLQRQVFVTNRIKTMNESIYYTVDYIQEAITKNLCISFHYFEWNERKEKILRHGGKLYTVSPWALTWDDENYYLIAYDSEKNEIRHYRVDKMLDLSVIDKPRDGKDIFNNFDTALYSKKTFGMFGGKEERVTLKCKNHLAGVIIDRLGNDVNFFKYDEEHFKINITVSVSPLFLTWVMNFGEDMKILSPQNVIDEFVNMAKKALKQYE